MKGYITTFKIASAIMSLPCGFLIAVQIFNLKTFEALVPIALLLLFWGSFWLLRKRIRFAFATSYLLALAFWLPLLYQTLRRIQFVLENGGMERTDGQGSPMAFLLGLTMEQFFFIPLTVVVLVGVMQWRRLNKAPNPEAPDSGARLADSDSRQ